MSKRFLPLIPVLSLVLLANRGVRESYDLQPQVETGQQLAFAVEVSGMLELVDAAIAVGSETLPGDPIVDVEFSMSHGADVEILAAEDGQATSLKVKFTDETDNYNGEASFMGNSQSFDESGDSKMLGHTVLIEADEDGEITVTDVSDDDSLEALSDEDLDGLDLDNEFAMILPKEPVEVGESWDIGAVALELFREGMEEEEGAEEVEKAMSLFGDASEIEFTGTLQSVEGTTAKIEWVLTLTMDQLDLVNFAREMGGGAELDQIPAEDFELSGSSQIELSGKGEFDLETHQLTDFTLEGEYSFDIDGGMSVQGSEVELSAGFEGTLEVSGGTTVE